MIQGDLILKWLINQLKLVWQTCHFLAIAYLIQCESLYTNHQDFLFTSLGNADVFQKFENSNHLSIKEELNKFLSFCF